MMKTIPVCHVTQSTHTEFEEFTRRFESQLGRHDISAYQNLLGSSHDAKEGIKILQHQEGESGLTRVLVYTDESAKVHVEKLTEVTLELDKKLSTLITNSIKEKSK